jgi:hypothetical protein
MTNLFTIPQPKPCRDSDPKHPGADNNVAAVYILLLAWIRSQMYVRRMRWLLGITSGLGVRSICLQYREPKFIPDLPAAANTLVPLNLFQSQQVFRSSRLMATLFLSFVVLSTFR